ncbi:MAG: septation protein A [Gammaproteobacteria bacterium]|nr:septation protein A [Gammaproteobacteria bacterium]
MKFLFDFFPILLFFITFKSYGDEVDGMVAATGVLIVATMIQVGYTWLKHKRIEKMHVITLVLVIIFGGATMYLREPAYLIWKVTIVNWLFALVFFGSHFVGKTPVIKRMMSHAIELPEKIWTRLSASWISFFFALGALNIYIGTQYDFDTWVDFKFYGMLGLTLGFTILQAVYISRYVVATDEQTTDSNGD